MAALVVAVMISQRYQDTSKAMRVAAEVVCQFQAHILPKELTTKTKKKILAVISSCQVLECLVI
jgi:hypothetical protein